MNLYFLEMIGKFIRLLFLTFISIFNIDFYSENTTNIDNTILNKDNYAVNSLVITDANTINNGLIKKNNQVKTANKITTNKQIVKNNTVVKNNTATKKNTVSNKITTNKVTTKKETNTLINLLIISILSTILFITSFAVLPLFEMLHVLFPKVIVTTFLI